MHKQSTLLFEDTSPEAEAVLVTLLRDAPAWRKLALVGDLNASVCALATAGIRARHPQADAAEVRRRLADLVLGEGLAARVYAAERYPEC